MKNLYLSTQIKAIDKLAADYLNISSYELMQLASQSIYDYVQQYNNILVVTGAGNNAGDGFVIANMARKHRKTVSVWSLVDGEKLPDDAKKAAKAYVQQGGRIVEHVEESDYDCIVDAVFGTGLSRDVEGHFAKAIKWINNQDTTVVAVDIPSGLDADTGTIKGCAINATMTVTVICYKPGLVTYNGKDLCGTLFCEELNIPHETYEKVKSQLFLLDHQVLNNVKFNHSHSSHKGSFGSAVIAGGHDGMLGALILSGRAAIRSGCGLVEAVSNNEQAVMISIQCPELMTANSIEASRLIAKTDVIAVGPGLGLNSQSKSVLNKCIEQSKPLVIDADGLSLLDKNKPFQHIVILTPHPKEAASLLNCSVNSIQNNRIKSAQRISRQYNTITILKGSGTVISDTNGDVYICPYGYAGMATAGMGDVLTGIVVSLLAQGFSAVEAAFTAVVWHAISAENCNKGIGLIASDVIHRLPEELI